MKIALGVTGGIAAYKAAEVLRLLQERGVSVQVIMTRAAQEFVRPLTFAALSGQKVITEMFGEGNAEPNVDSAVEHIAVAQEIDALLIVPATADTLAKLAQGIANDFLSTLYLATTAPVIIAPAMNVNMWEHPATRGNLDTLRSRGVHVVEPGAGYLACGMVGSGRLADPQQIVVETLAVLGVSQDLSGETVLITAGPTYEPIDPVRFLGNRSSGKMGYALAEAALARGARVLLISAVTSLTPPAGAELFPVVSSDDMRTAVLGRMPEATIIIKAAAVSDYRVKVPAEHKIKRRDTIQLELEPTLDILAEVAANRPEGTLVIGFAAETEDHLRQGRDKLLRKGADALVLNDVGRRGIGFDSDRNAATFLTAQTAIELPEMSKRELADRILDEIRALRRPSMILEESSAPPPHTAKLRQLS